MRRALPEMVDGLDLDGRIGDPAILHRGRSELGWI